MRAGDIPWWEKTLCGFDLETTAADPNVARTVTASVVIDDPTQDSPIRKEWLVDPGVEIPEEAASIHGITTDMARADGLPAKQATQEILTYLLDCAPYPLVIFNAAYDLTVLDRECQRHLGQPGVGVNGWPWTVMDPFVLDKQLDRYRRGSRKLQDMVPVYGAQLVDAHNSTADTEAAIAIVRAMGRRAPFPDVDSLMVRQAAWKEKQVDGLESYFIRTMQFDGVPLRREWPVVPGVPA